MTITTDTVIDEQPLVIMPNSVWRPSGFEVADVTPVIPWFDGDADRAGFWEHHVSELVYVSMMVRIYGGDTHIFAAQVCVERPAGDGLVPYHAVQLSKDIRKAARFAWLANGEVRDEAGRA